MKNIVFALIFIYLISQIGTVKHCNNTDSTETDDKIEYIQNRNFDDSLSINKQKNYYYSDTIKYWKNTKQQIKINYGQILNKKWPKDIVVTDLQKENDISQIFHVPNEVQCDFFFMYSASDDWKNSGIEVKVNGNILLSNLTLSDNEVKNFSTKVNSIHGLNTVEFADINQNKIQNGTLISQVSFKCPLYKKIEFEFLKNNYFNESVIFPISQSYLIVESIPNWKISSNSLKITNSRHHLKKNWFYNLNTFHLFNNQTLYQKFNVPSKMNCTLSFYYNQFKDDIFMTSFAAKLNDVCVFSSSTTEKLDDTLHYVTISVMSKCGLNKVSFSQLKENEKYYEVLLSGVHFKCSPFQSVKRSHHHHH